MRPVSWLRLIVPVAVLLSLLQGCSLTQEFYKLTRDPLAQAAKAAGVPVQPLGTDRNNFGTIVFYEYQKGSQCSFGYDFTPRQGNGGSGGSGSGPCVANPPTLAYEGGGSSSSAPGQPPLSLLYGRIRDTKAVRVTVLFPSRAEPMDARVVGQVWYVMYQGQLDATGPVVVKAFDKAGTLLHSSGTGGQ